MSLMDFVKESNRIEGIRRTPTQAELNAHEAFISLVKPAVEDLQALVSVLQPGALLRDKPGRDVRVGSYYPPPGGAEIKRSLEDLLLAISQHTPYTAHKAYESLHPFTDGNGRSGRVLWLWMMKGRAPLGFLHEFYYQSLAESGR